MRGLEELNALPTGNDNNSAHYKKGNIECIDYITDKGMNYVEGNIIKYITRYRDKGGLQDLFKVRWYITRLINDYTLELGLLEPKVGVSPEVSLWKRKSPGATGEATINDEYYQLSKEDEDEYIKSLNQLHIEPGVPFESNDWVLPEDDNDWSEENCRRPFGIEGKQIVDDREIELVVEEPAPAYPKGHPYTTEYPTPSPCGHHSRGCIHRG
jgi:hypothetical protein